MRPVGEPYSHSAGVLQRGTWRAVRGRGWGGGGSPELSRGPATAPPTASGAHLAHTLASGLASRTVRGIPCCLSLSLGGVPLQRPQQLHLTFLTRTQLLLKNIIYATYPPGLATKQPWLGRAPLSRGRGFLLDFLGPTTLSGGGALVLGTLQNSACSGTLLASFPWEVVAHVQLPSSL